MRVLQLHTSYRQRGGEDGVVDCEALLLRDGGHEVRQLIRHNPTSPVSTAGNLAFSPWNPAATRQVLEIAEEFDPDVVHVHNTWFATSPAPLRGLHKRGIPIVKTLHNYRLTCANAMLFRDGKPCEVCVTGSPWNAVRYGCYRGSSLQSIPAAATIAFNDMKRTWHASVDRYIALSNFQRDLMSRAGLPGEKIVVKPNSTDDPGDRTQRPSESNKVIFVGRISPEKGIRLLLESWQLADTGDLELLVAGDGPLLNEVRQSPIESVRSLGPLTSEEIQALMLRSRAAVIPSRWYEGMPLVLVEAFAAGLPAVTSNLGAPGEIASSALGSDWLFKTPNRDSLVTALERLTNDEFCDEASVLARAAYESRYTGPKALQTLSAIYDSAIESAKQRS